MSKLFKTRNFLIIESIVLILIIAGFIIFTNESIRRTVGFCEYSFVIPEGDRCVIPPKTFLDIFNWASLIAIIYLISFIVDKIYQKLKNKKAGIN